jgi:hypothetical protein
MHKIWAKRVSSQRPISKVGDAAGDRGRDLGVGGAAIVLEGLRSRKHGAESILIIKEVEAPEVGGVGARITTTGHDASHLRGKRQRYKPKGLLGTERDGGVSAFAA